MKRIGQKQLSLLLCLVPVSYTHLSHLIPRRTCGQRQCAIDYFLGEASSSCAPQYTAMAAAICAAVPVPH